MKFPTLRFILIGMAEIQILLPHKQIYSMQEIKALGLSHYKAAKLVDEKKLAHLNKSPYENLTFSGEPNDFYFVPAFIPSGVICLMSAAVYYNLTTYRPDSIDVAVANRKKISTMPETFNIKLHYFSKEKLELGVNHINVDGNSFVIFDIEKTVVDIICARNKVGIEETKEILVNYLSLPERNINKLYRYAEKLRCLRTLKSYLEVLL